ncbi:MULTISPECIES: phosphoenolpyruvate--protein phosphotransferase [unclassified Paenibacillus]|uniref:phosphoenolpyruvate--protein phosphotransferase n=1 Tax=unclassified Paenibacillus TaxID=185978 RepID=UPI001C125A2C|nr:MULTISPECIES: phosphoenolpyruvate--protein phosphotransferase [unclassified Paenibacillus]MBU5444908.1 phosphoenolpyruvate--protein phosphotransferase [Paenibacillus sp. MSJ-34]CAH0121738.1 Phosphoenolpyruvate-protein phosphotransferase [Paenibacillus sp. CECT 9249]
MAERHIHGIGVSDGIRIAKAFVFADAAERAVREIVEPGETEAELARLSEAKQRSEADLAKLAEQAKQTLGEKQAGILVGQARMLSDPAFYPQIEKKVREQNFSAEHAVRTVSEHFAERFEQMDNEYMRERAADIRDVSKRLLTRLEGRERISLADLREEAIVIADDLAPSDTVQLDKRYVQALVTRLGGKTSHTSILARSLGIAAVVGAGDEVSDIAGGELLIVDGSQGLCIRAPEPETIEEYRRRMQSEQEEQKSLEQFRLLPAKTKDGVRIETAANIGTPQEAAAAAEHHADGVGLYRTEFLYMNANRMPDEDEQFAAYREVAERMEGRPVVVRTLDIGGDKELPYLALPKEANPFLGYRAIRIGLDRRELLLAQLRAILRSSRYGNVKIMFPMISSLEEWRQAKAVYDEARAQLAQENIPVSDSVELGIMIEIPSAALLADAFAKEVDFFSIGTNDLVQYTLAVDRMNEKVAYLYDYFHPAVLQLIRRVIEAAHREGKWAGMCGGMAGDPLAAPLLLGLGLDEWSMDAGSIVKIKRTLSRLDSGECRALADRLLQEATTEEVRRQLTQYMETLHSD